MSSIQSGARIPGELRLKSSARARCGSCQRRRSSCKFWQPKNILLTSLARGMFQVEAPTCSSFLHSERTSARAATVRTLGSRSPLTYLLTDAGVRHAASASSFWLIPRSLSKAVSLFPVNVAILYPFSVVCGKNYRILVIIDNALGRVRGVTPCFYQNRRKLLVSKLAINCETISDLSSQLICRRDYTCTRLT